MLRKMSPKIIWTFENQLKMGGNGSEAKALAMQASEFRSSIPTETQGRMPIPILYYIY